MADREPFYKTFGKELLGTAAKWGEFLPGSELFKGIGTALATPTISKYGEETLKREEELQEQIVKQIREARMQSDRKKMDRLKKVAEQSRITIPGEKILEEAPTTRQIIASGVELALLASMGLKPTASNLKIIQTGKLAHGKRLKAGLRGAKVIKEIRRADVLKGAKLGKRIAVKFGKPAARSIAEGAAWFGAAKASERDAEVSDIIKSAEQGALIGGILTGGLIGVTKGVQAFGKYAGPKISTKYQKLLGKLEQTATGAVPKTESQVDKSIATSLAGKPTLKSKLAKKTIDVIEESKKFRTRLVDRFYPAYRVEKKLERSVNRPLKEHEKIHRDFSLADAVADGRTEVMSNEFLGKLGKYSDISDKYTAWLLELDNYDRVKLGLKIPGIILCCSWTLIKLLKTLLRSITRLAILVLSTIATIGSLIFLADPTAFVKSVLEIFIEFDSLLYILASISRITLCGI